MKRWYRLIPVAPAMALGGTLGLIALAITLLSDNPQEAISYLLAGPAMNGLALGNFLETSGRLTIAGVAASLAFHAGSFNLGGEGQALAGGLAAAAVALYFPSLPSILALLLALGAGIVAGALLGFISGVLRALWNVDEMISSFLISAAAAPVGEVLLGRVLKDPGSYLIAAPPLPDAFRLSFWWPPSRLGPVVLWAALITIAAAIFFQYTRRGYEWKLNGVNQEFARYGGIRTGLIAIGSLSLSGALYSTAGVAALLDGGQAVQGFTDSLGWDGLAIALIAGNRPELAPLAALAYTWLILGTQAAVLHTGFPYSMAGFVQGVVLLLVTIRLIKRHGRERRYA